MKKILAGSDLKWIAIVTMLIDHIGAIFFKDIMLLRMIGRLAFPIFAFLLIEGFYHSRNLKRYQVRLFLLAIISEVAFDLAFNDTWFEVGHQNIFFTLFLGLSAVMIFDQLRHKTLVFAWGSVLVIAILSALLSVDYTYLGIAIIFLFYYHHDHPERARFSVGAVFVLLAGATIYQYSAMSGQIIWQAGIQGLAALAMPLIAMYNGQRGMKLKYVFYFFYPVHLLILFGINQLFFR